MYDNGMYIEYWDVYVLPRYDILLKCWNQNPKDRPSFGYLHDFFRDQKLKVIAMASDN